MLSSRFHTRMVAFLFTTVALLTLTAGAQAKVTISFWNLFTGGDGDIMQEIVQQYNASQDRVQVEMTILPWGDPYYSKLMTATIGGAPPEVAVMHASRLLPYAKGGLMLELTPQIQQLMGIKSSDFFPAPWQSGQYQGRQYAIPLDIHPNALYYNVDHFAKAGFPEAPPANGDVLISIAKKLTYDQNGDGTNEQWGYTGAGAREWYGALVQFGGNILAPNGKDVAFLDGSGVKAIDFYNRLTDAIGGRWGGDFGQRTASMWQVGPWEIGRLERLGIPFNTAPMPQIGPLGNATWADSHLLYVPTPIAKGDPAKLEAAYDFIHWLANNAYLWSKGAGHVPTMKTVVAKTDFLKLEHQKAFVQAVDFAQYYPQVGQSTDLETAIHESVWLAWDRKASPQEAVERMAQRIKAIVAQD